MSALDVRSIDESQLPRQPCPPVKQEFRVFLSESAFDRAVARGDSDVTREIGGVLVGELLRDEAGPYLQIDATIDALHAEEKGAELTFTHATWEHIHKEMDSRHKDKRVVGWYHTHPGFGVFLSDRDQFIHKSFFNLPFQVAFVYDPKSHEHGLFTWHDNEVWRARRYWIGAREQVWDGVRAPADLQGRDKPEPDRRKPVHADLDDQAGRLVQPQGDLGQPGTLGMFAVVGVILLLLGGAVGHWWASRSTSEALVQAQVEIVKARSEGAQLTLASLQRDLVGILRDTISDEAMHRPVTQAVAILDQMIAALPAQSAVRPGAAVAGQADPPAEAPGTVAPRSSAPAPSGPGAAVTDSSAPAASGAAAAGSSAPAPSGPGAAAAGRSAPAASGPGAAAAGSSAPAASGAALPVAASADPQWAAFATQLKTARASLIQLEQARASAQSVLARLAIAAQRGNEQPQEVTRQLADQRSGLGAVYAELASDAAKAGDQGRARRLLTTASHLDPGNRARYEKQLQSFERSGRLPSDTTDSTGSAGRGAQR